MSENQHSYYGIRGEDTFLADMPIPSRERTKIWHTEKWKEESAKQIIKATLNHKKLPD